MSDRSLTLGYRPDHIATLRRETQHTIDSLRTFRSGDPAAAAAIHRIRLTRIALETHWMPLLDEIGRSRAMAHWSANQLLPVIGRVDSFFARLHATVTHWFTYDGVRTKYSSLTDIELIDMLWESSTRADVAVPDTLHDSSPADPQLALELSARVETDEAFRQSILDQLIEMPVVGSLITTGHFSEEFEFDVVSRFFETNPRELDFGHTRLLGDAGGAIDFVVNQRRHLLLDLARQPHVLHNLYEWAYYFEDPSLAEQLIVGVLVADAPDDPPRTADRYAVLTQLVADANDTAIDREGFAPGLSSGIVGSLNVYLPSFIGTIEGSDLAETLNRSRVNADSNGDGEFDMTLGTYEELTDFFGALMHDEKSIHLLGETLVDSGRLVASEDFELDDVAEFAALLQVAAENEQAETAMDAAALTARRNNVLGVLSLGTSLTRGATGAAAIIRSRLKQLSSVAKFVQPKRETSDGNETPDFGATVSHVIQIEMVRRLAAEPAYREANGLEASDARWAEVDAHIKLLDQLHADDASLDEISRRTDTMYVLAKELGADVLLSAVAGNVTLAVIEDRSTDED